MNWRDALFTPRGFLMVAGAILLVVGIIGFFILNSPSRSYFWLDNTENIAHTALGVIALAAVFVPGVSTALEPSYRSIVVLLAVVALFFGVYGFIVPGGSPAAPNTFGVANLELGDNLLNLIGSVWAFAAAFWSPHPHGAPRA